jgi:hypothetical protein
MDNVQNCGSYMVTNLPYTQSLRTYNVGNIYIWTYRDSEKLKLT